MTQILLVHFISVIVNIQIFLCFLLCLVRSLATFSIKDSLMKMVVASCAAAWLERQAAGLEGLRCQGNLRNMASADRQ